MVTKVTGGVKVSVETFYQPQHSDPRLNHFVFAYRIAIENCSEHTVQLKRRHWIIIDADGQHREGEGEGVVLLESSHYVGARQRAAQFEEEPTRGLRGHVHLAL